MEKSRLYNFVYSIEVALFIVCLDIGADISGSHDIIKSIKTIPN